MRARGTADIEAGIVTVACGLLLAIGIAGAAIAPLLRGVLQ